MKRELDDIDEADSWKIDDDADAPDDPDAPQIRPDDIF